MKKYTDYRDFIPSHYVEKQKVNESKSKGRGLFYLLILNILLLPVNISNITKIINKNEKVEVVNVINNKSISLNKWLELNIDGYNYISVNNDKGKIELTDIEDVYKIEESGFKIKKIQSSNGKFVVEVVRGN